MQVRSLDHEDPLEKEMATHSSMRDMLGFYAHLLAKLVHFSHGARNSSHFLQSVCGEEYQQARIC